MNFLELEKDRRRVFPEEDISIRPGEKISFRDWFGNPNPVEVEMGCGKAKFLIARAESSPEINFFGIDWARKWIGFGIKRSQKRNLPNLKLVRTHARSFLEAFASGQISVFHIYFPDPWPKRRHWRRRLINPEFLERLYECLRPGGLVEIATDHEDYYRAIKSAIASSRVPWSSFRESLNRRIVYEAFKTNYEIKYETAGRDLYYMELQKP